MDDLDRCFDRLKRINFDTLTDLMNPANKILSIFTMNPVTFEIELLKHNRNICINNGWTEKEYIEEYFRRVQLCK
jgi:hypothetical protein